MAAAVEHKRRGGTEGRRTARASAPLVQKKFITRKIPVYELLTEEGLDTLHQTSMTILEEIGIDFRDPVAVEHWKTVGADIRGERLHLDRGLLAELLARAPASYVQNARNAERSVTIGGPNTVLAPTYGSPFVRDFEDKRRYGTLEDLRNFVKLAYMTPNLHHSGGVICEPVDVPVPKRHLDIVYSHMKFSDKPFMGIVTHEERAEDCVKLCRILFGDAFIEAGNTVMTSVVNCNSPLVWDETMLGALKVYARANQAVVVAPFVLAGANTPASAMGALAQLNAEALAGIAFAQLCRPGAPMIYGHFLAAVSMKSGAPMAGTPELAFLNYAIGQLARKYRLPLRSSGMLCGAPLRADALVAASLRIAVSASTKPSSSSRVSDSVGSISRHSGTSSGK